MYDRRCRAIGRLRGYYAILDVRGPDAGSRPRRAGARAEELLAARPCCLQLRAKQLGGRDLLALARALVAACRRAGVPFCVNDRLDVALIAGADLVHVGQDDLPLADVRRVLDRLAGRAGGRLAVGVSTHSLAQARAAVATAAPTTSASGRCSPPRSKLRPDPVVGLAGAGARSWRRCRCRWWPSAASPARSWPGGRQPGRRRRRSSADIDNATHRLTAAREVAAAFGSTLNA